MNAFELKTLIKLAIRETATLPNPIVVDDSMNNKEILIVELGENSRLTRHFKITVQELTDANPKQDKGQKEAISFSI